MSKYIVANWKMNPQTLEDAKKILAKILVNIKTSQTKVIFCPPFVFLPVIAKKIKKLNIGLGAQNIFWQEKGAYTGEISPLMIRNFGCKFAIVGHSERRENFGETDKIINLKLKAALNHNIAPILCIGEKEREGAFDLEAEIIKNQLLSALEDIPKIKAKNLIIAYEPVWAIGAGRADAPDHTLIAVLFIKKTLASFYGEKIAKNIPILYGGSVNSKNALGFLKESKIDGFLVGGASLIPEEFARIIELTNNKISL